MTVEKMCFISPDDIRGVRIECSKCGAATFIPIVKLANIATRIGTNCLHCGAASGLQSGTQEWQEVVVFSDTLSKLAGHMQGRNIKYSLTIECPSE